MDRDGGDPRFHTPAALLAGRLDQDRQRRHSIPMPTGLNEMVGDWPVKSLLMSDPEFHSFPD